MKSTQVTHHTGSDGSVFAKLHDVVETIRTGAGYLASANTWTAANIWTALSTFTLAGNTARFVNTTDNASVQVVRLEGDRATMADGDEAYASLMLSNDAGTQTEFGRLTWVATDVNAGTSVDGRIDIAVVTGGSLADELALDGTALFPATNDGLALGKASTGEFADAFFAAGAVLNFANGAALLTHNNTDDLLNLTVASFAVGNVDPYVNAVIGARLGSDGVVSMTASGTSPLLVNRNTDDGALATFAQNGTGEGSITVSGATVSYNAFLGSHWAQLSDNSTPEIPLGTVMDSLDEMCAWVWDKWKTTDEDGKVTHHSRYYTGPLGDGETFIEDGVVHTIKAESNDRLPRVKISDSPASKSVYGTFLAWDRDDDAGDMSVMAVGAGYVRLAAGEIATRGVLVESAGNGCGRVQGDNIVRASTICKVTSATVARTHEDGSFVVPCHFKI